MKFLWKILSNENVQLAAVFILTAVALVAFVKTYNLDFTGLMG